MGKVGKWGIAVAGVVLVAGAGTYYFIHHAQRAKAQAAAAAAGPPAIPVSVGTAEAKDMPVYVRGIGTVQAYNMVTVKSRVDGQIMSVAFKQGQEVKQGDPLFQIDPRPFQAVLDQAMANEQRSEAQLTGAQQDLERYSKLVGSGFQSRQSVDQQKAIADALKGSIAADKAAIETAKLNLEYADIRAPISGRTGPRLVDAGNFIQVSQNTALVSITQVKPIYVNFTVPQEQTDAIRTHQKEGALAVVAFGTDDKVELGRGTLTLIDNQIDATTGTLKLKATFENADERLWPGEFVNARLILTTRKDAVTVPRRAVMLGASDSYLYVVKADETVERRTVTVAATSDKDVAIIEKGLAAGDKIVVDGQYRLRNGSKIKIETQAQQQQPSLSQQPPPQSQNQDRAALTAEHKG